MKMMKCKHIQRRLSAFLDQELDAPIAQMVQQHLPTCSACQAELERLQAVVEFIKIAEPLPAQPFLLTRIQARLRQTRIGHETRATRKVLSKALIPFAMAAGIWLGITLGDQLMVTSAANINSSAGNGSYLDKDIFNPIPSGSITENYATLLPWDESNGGGSHE